MADMKILFTVLGGDDITSAGTSGKTIADQLNSIVSKINTNPLEIKFKADDTSLNALKSRVQEITSSLGSVGAIKPESADFSEMAGSIKRISGLFEKDFGKTFASIARNSQMITVTLRKINEAAQGIRGGFANILANDKFKNTPIKAELESIYKLLVLINEKEVNVSNIFDFGRGESQSRRLELERERAEELLRIYRETSQQVEALNRSDAEAFGKSIKNPDLKAEYIRMLNDRRSISDYAVDIAGAETLPELSRLERIIDNRIVVLGSILRNAREAGVKIAGAEIPAIDSSRLNEISKSIKDYDELGDSLERAAVSNANVISGIVDNMPDASAFSDDTLERIKSINDMYAEVDKLFTELRKKIESTFDLNSLELDISNIRSTVEQIQDEFDKLELKVGIKTGGVENNQNGVVSAPTEVGINKVTLGEAERLANNIREILNNNTNAKNLYSFKSLEKILNNINPKIKDAIDKGRQAEDVFNEFGVRGLTRAKSLIEQITHEITQSNLAGNPSQPIAPNKVTLGEAENLANSIHEVLNSNGNAGGLYSFKALQSILNNINPKIQEAIDKGRAAEDIFDEFGTRGLERARSLLAQLNFELIQKNLSGNPSKSTGSQKVTLGEAEKLANNIRELLNANGKAKDLYAFKALDSILNNINPKIQEAINKGRAAEDVFDEFGFRGLERAKSLIEQLNFEMTQNGLLGNPTTPKTKKVTVQDALDLANKVNDILTKNTRAGGITEYVDLESRLSNLNTNINSANNSAKKLDDTFDGLDAAGLKEIEELIDRLTYKMKQLGLSGKTSPLINTLPQSEIDAYSKQIEQALNQAGRVLGYSSAKTAPETSSFFSSAQTSVDELEALKNSFGSMTKEQFAAEIGRIKLNITEADSAIKRAGKATKSWSDRFGSLTKKFTEWFGAAQIVSAIWRAMQRMVTSVIELDTAMTELRKVTDETEATYDRFLVNAANRAKNLGSALTDVVTASADFARLGYDINEAEKMADAAIIYKNVGDGIQDINQASESIIATMQAFGVEADDVMTIVDKFNTIGRILPIYTVMC